MTKTFRVKVDGRYWIHVRLYDTYDKMYASVRRRWDLEGKDDYRAMFIPIKDTRDSSYLGEIVFQRERFPGACTVSHEVTHAVSWLVCRKGWKNVFKMKGLGKHRGGGQQEAFATMIGDVTEAIARRIW